MRRLQYLILIIVLPFRAIIPGEYGDAFILASIHPQVYSLGNSAVATTVLSGHALNNPAGFTSGPQKSIGIVYDQFNGLTQSIGLETKFKVSEKYDLGLTFLNNSISDLYFRPNLSGLTPQDRRDSVLTLNEQDSDVIKYRESAVFLTVAREFNFYIDLGWIFFKIPCRVPVGMSVKYIDKILDENRGLGSGIDAGGQFFFNLGGMTDALANTEFSFGLHFSDILNTPIYWDTQHQDAIGRQLTFGYAATQNIKKYGSKITFSKSSQTRYADVSQYGLELTIKDRVYFRGGHDGYTTSFGLGIGLKKVIIDYSFSQHELSDMQKIGISYHF